jgi:hypothetical protein
LLGARVALREALCACALQIIIILVKLCDRGPCTLICLRQNFAFAYGKIKANPRFFNSKNQNQEIKYNLEFAKINLIGRRVGGAHIVASP